MTRQIMANDDDSYEEYARKMDLFMEGLSTTNFEQLTADRAQSSLRLWWD
jgi:hypothetical protein